MAGKPYLPPFLSAPSSTALTPIFCTTASLTGIAVYVQSNTLEAERSMLKRIMLLFRVLLKKMKGRRARQIDAEAIRPGKKSIR